jgi:hypothetical protein
MRRGAIGRLREHRSTRRDRGDLRAGARAELRASRGARASSVGYSPERINPGDPVRNLGNVKKIVAGDSPATADRLCALYGSIVGAGIYRAPSIKVAEAAKVLENTQRDLNIALMNEVAIVFHRPRHRHRRGARRPRRPSGTSCRSSPGSSAATASASTRTT